MLLNRLVEITRESYEPRHNCNVRVAYKTLPTSYKQHCHEGHDFNVKEQGIGVCVAQVDTETRIMASSSMTGWHESPIAWIGIGVTLYLMTNILQRVIAGRDISMEMRSVASEAPLPLSGRAPAELLERLQTEAKPLPRRKLSRM